MTEQPDAERVTSRRDAVLWMWKAHNQVKHASQYQANPHMYVQASCTTSVVPGAVQVLTLFDNYS